MNNVINKSVTGDRANKQLTLYRGLSHWQLKSEPSKIRKYYYEKYINIREACRKSNAFFNIPSSMWDVEEFSLGYRQNLVFPERSAWPCVSENKSMCSVNSANYIKMDGPVKLMSWCPNVSNNRQILTVYVSWVEKNCELNLKPDGNKDLIHIVDCGDNYDKTIKPKILYSFIHDWGSIISMQWISPDIPDMAKCVSFQKSPVKVQPLYGHMLFCCSDGYMRVCPIPNISQHQFEISPNKILSFNSNNIMKLGLGHDYLNDTRSFFGYPTCSNWISQFPGWIIAGYSSGHIGIFDLTCLDLFHYDFVNHYLIPVHKRRLSYYPVTSIAMSPNNWQAFNYTVDSGDAAQCNFVYKFTERTEPVVIVKSDTAVKTCLWPSRADLLVSIPVTRDSVDITSILSHKTASVKIKGIRKIVSFDKENSLIVAAESGSLTMISLSDTSIVEELMVDGIPTDFIHTTDDIQHYRRLNTKDSNGRSTEKFLNSKSTNDITHLYKLGNVSYPTINTIDINPNIGVCGLTAIGFECGTIHLLRVTEAELRDSKILTKKGITSTKIPQDKECLIENNPAKRSKKNVRVTPKSPTEKHRKDHHHSTVKVKKSKASHADPLERLLFPKDKSSPAKTSKERSAKTKCRQKFSDIYDWSTHSDEEITEYKKYGLVDYSDDDSDATEPALCDDDWTAIIDPKEVDIRSGDDQLNITISSTEHEEGVVLTMEKADEEPLGKIVNESPVAEILMTTEDNSNISQIIDANEFLVNISKEVDETEEQNEAEITLVIETKEDIAPVNMFDSLKGNLDTDVMEECDSEATDMANDHFEILNNDVNVEGKLHTKISAIAAHSIDSVSVYGNMCIAKEGNNMISNSLCDTIDRIKEGIEEMAEVELVNNDEINLVNQNNTAEIVNTLKEIMPETTAEVDVINNREDIYEQEDHVTIEVTRGEDSLLMNDNEVMPTTYTDLVNADDNIDIDPSNVNVPTEFVPSYESVHIGTDASNANDSKEIVPIINDACTESTDTPSSIANISTEMLSVNEYEHFDIDALALPDNEENTGYSDAPIVTEVIQEIEDSIIMPDNKNMYDNTESPNVIIYTETFTKDEYIDATTSQVDIEEKLVDDEGIVALQIETFSEVENLAVLTTEENHDTVEEICQEDLVEEHTNSEEVNPCFEFEYLSTESLCKNKANENNERTLDGNEEEISITEIIADETIPSLEATLDIDDNEGKSELAEYITIASERIVVESNGLEEEEMKIVSTGEQEYFERGDFVVEGNDESENMEADTHDSVEPDEIIHNADDKDVFDKEAVTSNDIEEHVIRSLDESTVDHEVILRNIEVDIQENAINNDQHVAIGDINICEELSPTIITEVECLDTNVTDDKACAEKEDVITGTEIIHKEITKELDQIDVMVEIEGIVEGESVTVTESLDVCKQCESVINLQSELLESLDIGKQSESVLDLESEPLESLDIGKQNEAVVEVGSQLLESLEVCEQSKAFLDLESQPLESMPETLEDVAEIVLKKTTKKRRPKKNNSRSTTIMVKKETENSTDENTKEVTCESVVTEIGQMDDDCSQPKKRRIRRKSSISDTDILESMKDKCGDNNDEIMLEDNIKSVDSSMGRSNDINDENQLLEDEFVHIKIESTQCNSSAVNDNVTGRRKIVRQKKNLARSKSVSGSEKIEDTDGTNLAQQCAEPLKTEVTVDEITKAEVVVDEVGLLPRRRKFNSRSDIVLEQRTSLRSKSKSNSEVAEESNPSTSLQPPTSDTMDDEDVNIVTIQKRSLRTKSTSSSEVVESNPNTPLQPSISDILEVSKSKVVIDEVKTLPSRGRLLRSKLMSVSRVVEESIPITSLQQYPSDILEISKNVEVIDEIQPQPSRGKPSRSKRKSGSDVVGESNPNTPLQPSPSDVSEISKQVEVVDKVQTLPSKVRPSRSKRKSGSDVVEESNPNTPLQPSTSDVLEISKEGEVLGEVQKLPSHGRPSGSKRKSVSEVAEESLPNVSEISKSGEVLDKVKALPVHGRSLRSKPKSSYEVFEESTPNIPLEIPHNDGLPSEENELPNHESSCIYRSKSNSELVEAANQVKVEESQTSTTRKRLLRSSQQDLPNISKSTNALTIEVPNISDPSISNRRTTLRSSPLDNLPKGEPILQIKVEKMADLSEKRLQDSINERVIQSRRNTLRSSIAGSSEQAEDTVSRSQVSVEVTLSEEGSMRVSPTEGSERTDDGTVGIKRKLLRTGGQVPISAEITEKNSVSSLGRSEIEKTLDNIVGDRRRSLRQPVTELSGSVPVNVEAQVDSVSPRRRLSRQTSVVPVTEDNNKVESTPDEIDVLKDSIIVSTPSYEEEDGNVLKQAHPVNVSTDSLSLPPKKRDRRLPKKLSDDGIILDVERKGRSSLKRGNGEEATELSLPPKKRGRQLSHEKEEEGNTRKKLRQLTVSTDTDSVVREGKRPSPEESEGTNVSDSMGSGSKRRRISMGSDSAVSSNTTATTAATKDGKIRQTQSWHTHMYKIAWQVEGRYYGGEQTVSGRLFDEEPEVGRLAQVHWSKPSSLKTYPAMVVRRM